MRSARTTSIPQRTRRVLLSRWQDTLLVIFAVGLVGASLLAAAVLPLATSYAVSEAFGFSKGVGLDFRRAPLFFTLFTGLIIFGAALRSSQPAGDQTISVDSGAKWRLAADLPGIHSPAYQ
jgi:hypothetical protein